MDDIDNVTKILQVRDKIDNLTEELNKRIIAFEEDLKKLRIGIPTWINISSNTRLGYIKFEGNWCVVVQSKLDDKQQPILPLTKSTRTLRLYGYKHLNLLIPAIQSAAESFLAKLESELNHEPDGNK